MSNQSNTLSKEMGLAIPTGWSNTEPFHLERTRHPIDWVNYVQDPGGTQYTVKYVWNFRPDQEWLTRISARYSNGEVIYTSSRELQFKSGPFFDLILAPLVLNLDELMKRPYITRQHIAGLYHLVRETLLPYIEMVQTD